MKTSLAVAPVSPIHRIPDMPIDPEFLVNRTLTRFEQFAADRVEWIMKREEYYMGWDDYTSPVTKGPWEGSSNVHLPLTEIQCMALHARLMQAFFFIDPWFFVDPQEDTDAERIQKIEQTMKYIVMRYSNYHKGIYLAVDDWCWDIVTEGMGILSRDWKIEQRRAIIVNENEDFLNQKLELENMLTADLDADEFEKKAKDLIKTPYEEKEIIRTTFNGPLIVAEDPSYILFKGDAVDATDLNLHETVIKVCYFSRDELIAFRDSEYMDEDAVNTILASPPQRRGASSINRATRLQYFQDRQTGVNTQDPSAPRDEYEFLCAYDRVAMGPNGAARKSTLADELVNLIHPGTRQLARWTFLDRISATGKRPLHMAHLYRRPRRTTGRGMVATQKPLNDACDILVNQGIDAGMLANCPMFGYRGNATFDPKTVRAEPGLGLKMDDPNNDLRFYTWQVNPGWSGPFQSLFMQLGQQLSSIGPLSFGGNVPGNRSNSQTQSILGETGVNLDVLLKRTKIPYAEMLEGLFADCVDRMPAKLKIASLGPDGEPMLSETGGPMMLDVSREDLRTRIHFGLYANSQNMNRMAQEAAAQKLAQFLFQPVALQTGVVRPSNVWEAYGNVIRTMGIPRGYRFITRPDAHIAIPLQAEMMMIMQGIQPEVVLNDPAHQDKIAFMEELLNSEQAAQEAQYGVVHKDAMKILEATLMKHKKMLQVVQKPSNLSNPNGMQTSPNLGAQGNIGNALSGESGGANNFGGPGESGGGGTAPDTGFMGGIGDGNAPPY